jgi:hypothetical protein
VYESIIRHFQGLWEVLVPVQGVSSTIFKNSKPKSRKMKIQIRTNGMRTFNSNRIQEI